MSKTYSLWLLPEGGVSKKYQEIITRLASTQNTQDFRPHITLIKNIELPEVEVLALTSELVETLKSIKTKVLEIKYSERWYRNIYLEVLNTPELSNAHELANQIFNHTEEPFMAHLSLVYGNLPLDIKLDITKNLKPYYEEFFTLDKLVVTEENSDQWKEIISYNL